MVSNKKTEIAISYISGALFALSWWVWIDATVYTNRNPNERVLVKAQHYVPAIISSVALVMINIVSWNDLNSSYFFGDGVSTKARIWMFFSFIVAFVGIIISVWMAVQNFFLSNPYSQYAGVALIATNIGIFVAGIMYRFAKPTEEDTI